MRRINKIKKVVKLLFHTHPSEKFKYFSCFQLVMEEKSLFIEILGDYPLIRVLNFLLIFREFDYSLTEIAEEAGVAWSTLHTVWPKLEQLGFVKQTREIGNAKLYKLNTENPLVQDFIRFSDKLVSNYTEEKIFKKVVIA